MPRRIGVAVLGFWHVHAADYAQLAQAHADTELVAVWDEDEDRGRAGARDFGIEYTGDLDALLARDDVDAVTVTTATSAHRDVMQRAAKAGKHIFTEKLLAPTVAEGEEIIAAADASGVSLIVSLPRLYHGYTRAVTDALNGEALGRLTYGRVRVSHDGAVAGWLPERFFDPREAIGGALTDLGCHPVYLIQRFLGADPETVSATYRSFTGRAVEDHAVVTVGYGDGRIGVIEAGFVSPGGFTIELHGTARSLVYADGSLRLSGPDGWTELPVPEDGEDAFAQWVAHIHAGTRADDNLARATELTRLVVAANEAAASGRTLAYR